MNQFLRRRLPESTPDERFLAALDTAGDALERVEIAAGDLHEQPLTLAEIDTLAAAFEAINRAYDRNEQPFTVNGFLADVLAERARQVRLGYDAAHDDSQGYEHPLRFAGHYLAKATGPGSRRSLVKAAACLLAAGEAYDRQAEQAAGGAS